ncbi:MAG: transposase [Gammaproteobacteria bacterium]|nr:transposase [Gammaproteobacteria bacterium]
MKKKVFSVRIPGSGKEDLKVDSLALISYEWTGDPFDFDVLPHGNSKRNEGFQRTRPCVIKAIRENAKKLAPKEAFSKTLDSCGGVLGAKSSSDMPRSRRQVYSQRQIHGFTGGVRKQTDFEEIYKMVQEQSWVKKFALLQKERESSGESVEVPIIFLASDRMLEVFKKYCVHDSAVAASSVASWSPLFVDTTFDLGPCYVTVLCAIHPEICEAVVPYKEPTVPVAYMLHKNLGAEEFHWFAETLKKKCHLSDDIRARCFVTDDDTALENGMKECTLFSSPCPHVLCGRHLRKNCERKLTEFRVDEKAKQEILVDIFGTEIQISNAFGRMRKGGLVDCNADEYGIAARRMAATWPEEFAKYFMRYKFPKIRDHYLLPVRESAGLGPGLASTNRVENLNMHLKSQQRMGRKGTYLPMDKIIESLRDYTKSLYAKLEGAPFDMGGYRMKDEDRCWKSVGLSFDLLGEDDKKVRLREFALDPTPLDNTVVEKDEFKLSLDLKANLQIPRISSTHPSSIQILEQLACGICKNGADCIRQKLGNLSEFSVEDFSENHRVFNVTQKKGAGTFTCYFGDRKCLNFENYHSLICQHTIAVASFIGELKEHVQYVNDGFSAMTAG